MIIYDELFKRASIFSIQYNSDIYDILKKNDNWFMTDYEVKRCYNYRWGL